MKTRSMSTVKRLGSVLAVYGVMTGGLSAWAQDRGSDIGHGVPGESLVGSIPRYEPIDAAFWCGEVGGYIDDALAISNLVGGPAASRLYLHESIQSILDSYQGAGLPFQPLTYSLLAATLKVDKDFPRDPVDLPQGMTMLQADQSAAISMFTLLKAAKRVNERFDVPRYVPYIEHRRCRVDCPSNWEPEPQFYIDYASSAQEVLDSLYAPVYESQPHRGSTLDAMSNEFWELNALLDLTQWVRGSLQNDVFNRQMVCVIGAVKKIEQRLKTYLGGHKAPFNDTTMRIFAERRLDDVRMTLRHFSYDDGRYSCGYRLNLR